MCRALFRFLALLLVGGTFCLPISLAKTLPESHATQRQESASRESGPPFPILQYLAAVVAVTVIMTIILVPSNRRT